MPEYRDPLGASLERVANLESELAATRSTAPSGATAVRVTSDLESLALENELLQLNVEWRSKQERFTVLDERRRTRIHIVGAVLFLFMAIAGIGLLFRGDAVPGMLFFVASAVGWIMAGLQRSRYSQARSLYEEDRRRVEIALVKVRRAMVRARVEGARARIGLEDEALARETEEDDAEMEILEGRRDARRP